MQNSVSVLTDEPQFRIVRSSADGWDVEFDISQTTLSDQPILLRYLRSVKRAVSGEYGVPMTKLVFDRLLSRKERDNRLQVLVRIRKSEDSFGNAELRFEEGVAPDGTRYPHMLAFLDVYALDEFREPMTMDRIRQFIAQHRVDSILVDWSTVERVWEEVERSNGCALDVQIAAGQFPVSGKDAEYLLHIGDNRRASPESRTKPIPVVKGQLLCTKTRAQQGSKPGLNVLGEVLAPRDGRDIELRAGAGTISSADGLEVYATVSGIAVMSRVITQIASDEEFFGVPSQLEFRVTSLVSVDGTDAVDVASPDSVEIHGGLKAGSRVLSQGDIYVHGDVSRGAVVEAIGDIKINGSMHGANVRSESSVALTGDVRQSNITARDKVDLAGTASETTVFAESVTAGELISSEVTAATEVRVTSVSNRDEASMSKIMVGAPEYIRRRLVENEQFLMAARANLERIESIFGQDITESVTPTNIQQMLMKFMVNHRPNLQIDSRKDVDVYRKLIAAILPTRALIAQKEREVAHLLARAGVAISEEPSVPGPQSRHASRDEADIKWAEANIRHSSDKSV